jgi:hypothetical protein
MVILRIIATVATPPALLTTGATITTAINFMQ